MIDMSLGILDAQAWSALCYQAMLAIDAWRVSMVGSAMLAPSIYESGNFTKMCQWL